MKNVSMTKKRTSRKRKVAIKCLLSYPNIRGRKFDSGFTAEMLNNCRILATTYCGELSPDYSPVSITIGQQKYYTSLTYKTKYRVLSSSSFKDFVPKNIEICFAEEDISKIKRGTNVFMYEGRKLDYPWRGRLGYRWR